MQTPIDILLIDDEKGYCDTLKTLARNAGIRITDVQNLEDGLKILQKDLKFKAIILDAKCLIDSEQEVEKFDFLPLALERLKAFEQQYNVHVPFVVNTGYSGEKELAMVERQIAERRGKLFSKTENKDHLFAYLLDEIAKADTTKLEREFASVFVAFERGFLPNDVRNDLLQVLQKRGSSNPSEIKLSLSAIRRVLEVIHVSLQNAHPSLLPKSKKTFEEKIQHLSLINLQPSYIEHCSRLIWKVSSNFGSHPDKAGDAKYAAFPSSYTVQSLTFALLEIIVWFIELMDNEVGLQKK